MRTLHILAFSAYLCYKLCISSAYFLHYIFCSGIFVPVHTSIAYLCIFLAYFALFFIFVQVLIRCIFVHISCVCLAYLLTQTGRKY